MQQEREETIMGYAVHAPKDCKAIKNQLRPYWELIYRPRNRNHDSHTFRKQTAMVLLFVGSAEAAAYKDSYVCTGRGLNLVESETA
ncbi:MAG: hypothetical protein WBQ31_11065, partial [Candidatus Acidiferrales bacterium]